MTTVYFLGHPNGKYIKLGITDGSLAERIHKLNHPTGAPEQHWTHLMHVCGMASHEGHLKGLFSKHRVTGFGDEVFNLPVQHIDWLRWLYHSGFVARTVECEPPPVTGDEWMPSPYKRMPEFAADPQQGTLYDAVDLDPWDHIRREPALTGDDYYTPFKILDAARSVSGPFDLDPASHPIANRAVKASRFYNVQENGLSLPWFGVVWCNPPFSEWDLWAPKALSEWRRGEVLDLFMLMPSRAITVQSNGRLINSSDAVAVTHGRIPFNGPLANNSPTDGHVICYFGPRRARFRESFGTFCKVLVPFDKIQHGGEHLIINEPACSDGLGDTSIRLGTDLDLPELAHGAWATSVRK